MSASVNQRAKGQPNQVSNGPGKEPMKEEFDAYLNTQPPQMTPWSSESVPRHHMQGGYGSAPMSSPSVSDTAYMQSYYPSMSFPYLGQGLSEGAWSNGGDPMSFLGSYGQMDNNYMQGTGMFGGFGYQPGFSWEFPGGEYNTWTTSTTQQQQQQPQQAAQQQQQQAQQQQQQQAQQQQQRKADERAAYDTGYYGMGHAEGYGAVNGDLDREMKGMEQGLKGMSMAERGGQEMVVAETGQVMHDPNQGLVLQQQQQQQQQVQQQQAPPPAPGPAQKKTWASIASQPAKPQIARPPKPVARAPVMSSKHNNNMDIGTWENKNGSGKGGNSGQQSRQAWGAPRGRSANGGQGFAAAGNSNAATSNGAASGPPTSTIPPPSHPVLDKLRSANQYNPKDFNLNPKGARYFIIKSYSEDDIHRSIKYSIWCSTEHGNKRLDAAYREREAKGLVYLFFSVNGSGHFCGMAQMMSPLDYNSSSSVWAQDKWKGQTEVKWIYVKDVPNSQLRHIRLENNENKPVTNSRDTQEVPTEKGKQVLKIIHNYRHTTSIFDDFIHYEKRQEEEQVKLSQPAGSPGQQGGQQGKPPREEDQPVPPREQQQAQAGGRGGRSRRGGGEGRGQYQSNGNAQN